MTIPQDADFPSFPSNDVATKRLEPGDQSADPQEVDASRQTSRFVVRFIPHPISAQPTCALTAQHVWILGRNAHAGLIAQHWRQAGASVTDFSCDVALESLLAEVERAAQKHVAQHLVIATAADTNADVDLATRIRDRVLAPLRIVQRWFELTQDAVEVERRTLSAMTLLGGDLGFDGHSSLTEGGAISGLLKSAASERPSSLCVKIVDFSPHEPSALSAKLFFSEVVGNDRDAEVAYLRGIRRVPQLIPVSASTMPEIPPPKRSTWIVTGGARGVTAFVARELAKRFDLKLHILGSTSLDTFDPQWRAMSKAELKSLKLDVVKRARADGQTPNLAWNRIANAIAVDRELGEHRASGIDAIHHLCDLTDRASVARTLVKIRQSDGPISGVLHGAGSDQLSQFTRTKLESISHSIAVKVGGAAHLIECTEKDPLEYFIGFGSVCGRFGAAAQIESCVANEWLAKIMNRFSHEHPHTKTHCLQWTAWDDVGSAIQPERRFVLEANSVFFMPAKAGLQHVADELTHRGGESEIIFTEFPNGPFGTRSTMPDATQWNAYNASQKLIQTSPLIEQIFDWNEDGFRARVCFRPLDDPFLMDHRHDGVPIVPAAVIIELCCEAARIFDPELRVAEIQHFRLHAGFRIAGTNSYAAELLIRREGDQLNCQLIGDFYKDDCLVDPCRLYASCTLVLDRVKLTTRSTKKGASSKLKWKPTEKLKDVCYDQISKGDVPWTTIQYGPNLRCLDKVSIDSEGLWGKAVAPDPLDLGGNRKSEGWIIPIAILDAAFLAPDIYASQCWSTRQLPAEVQSIQFLKPVQEGKVYWIRTKCLEKSEKLILSETEVIGEDGTTAIKVSQFTDAILAPRKIMAAT